MVRQTLKRTVAKLVLFGAAVMLLSLIARPANEDSPSFVIPNDLLRVVAEVLAGPTYFDFKNALIQIVLSSTLFAIAITLPAILLGAIADRRWRRSGSERAYVRDVAIVATVLLAWSYGLYSFVLNMTAKGDAVFYADGTPVQYWTVNPLGIALTPLAGIALAYAYAWANRLRDSELEESSRGVPATQQPSEASDEAPL